MTIEQHRRVLLVDDDDDVRSVLVTALRPKPLLVDEAANGRAALELLAENTYAVVVLDLLLPEVDGFAVCEAIERRGGPPPVVLVVTGADHAVTDQLDSRRIHGIIRKPFDPEEIASIVSACAEIRSRSAFEAMALATMISGAPLIALLNKL